MASYFAKMNPATRTLSATIATAYGIQVAAGSIAIPLQTESFYDLVGSLTFVTCTLVSLYFPSIYARVPLRAYPSILSFHPRQLVASGFTLLWAGRLGTFLYDRIKRAGSDTRFDEIKKSPAAFSVAWGAQGTWVALTALPVFALNSIPRHLQPALGPRDVIAAAFWIGSFGFEVIADRQKSAWRARKNAKEHDEQFISSGLWSISRHPNYVGEIGLWTAQAFASYSALSSPAVSGPLFPAYVAYAMAISPLAEYGLIRYISGVPLLEKSGDDKFGKDPKWIAYKERVPVFFPKLFG